MERYVKGSPVRIEFGMYDNWATMIPVEILDYKPEGFCKVFIRWQYPGEDRYIDLWTQEEGLVDFESFGYNKS